MRQLTSVWFATIMIVGLLILTSTSVVSAACVDQLGDVNGDASTNVVDLQCIVVVILGSDGDTPDCLGPMGVAGSDVMCDGTTSVVDAVFLIGLILGDPISETIDANGNACPDACEECEPGDTQPADDGCNTCTCMDNSAWACTLMACPECQVEGGSIPVMPGAMECCEGLTPKAKQPLAFDENGECKPPLLGVSVCMNCGDGFCAGDWENVCSCPEDCQAPECEPGDTKPAGDGCNTCACTDDGMWVCTLIFCPPTCQDSSECPGGQYCQKDDEDCQGEGVCAIKPDGCGAIYDPVCGCDAKTYTNGCDAATQGINVAAAGECGSCPDGSNPVQCFVAPCMFAECAAYPNAECVDNYCGGCFADFYVDGSLVDCTPCEYGGQTYQVGDGFSGVGDDWCNSCSCMEGGMVACTKIGCPTQCSDDDECAADEYCAYDEHGCQGPGICAWMPDFCTLEYIPVCGCDDQTYGNDCKAAANGVNIAHEGVCPSSSCEYGGNTYQEGDSFAGVGNDWCNTCFCDANGMVACTEMACGCPPPVPYDGICAQVVVWVENPSGGECCGYGTPCSAPPGFEIYYSPTECMSGCPDVFCTLFCEYGFKVDANGCSLCECNEAPPGECAEGETKEAGDGCNWCICGQNSMWNCTKQACQTAICPKDTEVVGHIATWCGKVNVFTDPLSWVWTVSPDCSSGCQLAGTVDYCQSLYPTSTDVVKTDVSMVSKPFATAGCTVDSPAVGHDQYVCCAPVSQTK